ncbi:MAG TPA: hypothetical protein VNQ34_04615 [Xanthobacteraceae bacterium]|nr:hypothetical protein [Xanthobacteraceae bacterium]
MQTSVVGKRAFLCIGGYEPIGVDWWHRRFQRELKRFETTWNAQSTVSPPRLNADGVVAGWSIGTKGANWQTESEYRLLRWDDFVTADFARSNFERWPKGIAALLDFVFSGAAFRYFAVSVRYGFFFLYPFVILAGIIASAIFAPRLLALIGLPITGLAAWLVSITVAGGLLYLLGRVLLLNYMFDDWIFAGQFVHRKRAELDARLDCFAREIVACARDTRFDEVIVSAHSLGGALIMDVLDRALKLDPELGQRGPKLWLMATGSSLLKEALHPKARWLREAVDRVAAAKGVNWIEYQAIVDVISFYKVNPVAAMGLPEGRNPIVQKVRMRQMLAPATYKRFKGNFFRLHRQWSMGNELRYFYDYFQIICGPAPLERRVVEREKLLDAFAQDGGYNASASAASDKVSPA